MRMLIIVTVGMTNPANTTTYYADRVGNIILFNSLSKCTQKALEVGSKARGYMLGVFVTSGRQIG